MVDSSQGGFFDVLSGSSSFLSIVSFIHHSLDRDKKTLPEMCPCSLETGLFGKRTLNLKGSDFPLARGSPGTSAFGRVGMPRDTCPPAHCVKQFGLVDQIGQISIKHTHHIHDR